MIFLGGRNIHPAISLEKLPEVVPGVKGELEKVTGKLLLPAATRAKPGDWNVRPSGSGVKPGDWNVPVVESDIPVGDFNPEVAVSILKVADFAVQIANFRGEMPKTRLSSRDEAGPGPPPSRRLPASRRNAACLFRCTKASPQGERIAAV